MTCSSIETTGIKEIWEMIQDHRVRLTDSGEMAVKRKEQALDWMTFLLDEGLRRWFYTNPNVKNSLPVLRKEVENGTLSPTAAADKLLAFLKNNPE